MFEGFAVSLNVTANLTFAELAFRLILTLVFGVIVAGVYVLTQRRSRSELVPMATTLVLLTILIAMVTLIIGNNVARAFSLAGALAIIRFRTVVEDTRDTAFVIFAVVVGMGVGADLIAIPLVGIPLVAGAAYALSFCGPPASPPGGEFALAIRIGLGHDPQSLLQQPFAKHLGLVRLNSTATARQGSALDLVYSVRLCDETAATALVAELNQIEGIQTVELRRL